MQTALLERGVSSNQIVAVGKGQDYPDREQRQTPTVGQRNRRVEMIFTDSKSRVASDVN